MSVQDVDFYRHAKAVGQLRASPRYRQVFLVRAHDSSGSWPCLEEIGTLQVYKTDPERTCGRRYAAAKGNRKRNVGTTSWIYVCSGLLDVLASEWRGVLPRDHSEWSDSPGSRRHGSSSEKSRASAIAYDPKGAVSPFSCNQVEQSEGRVERMIGTRQSFSGRHR